MYVAGIDKMVYYKNIFKYEIKLVTMLPNMYYDISFALVIRELRRLEINVLQKRQLMPILLIIIFYAFTGH